MDDNQKLRFGPYVTPVTAVGTRVECEVRGFVTVVRLVDGPILWPVGERDGVEDLIVFKSLARAIRLERPEAIAAAWNVTLDKAEAWKAACHTARVRKKQTRKSQPIPWKAADDELIMRLSLEEAARLTGRTLTAIRKRRRALGLPDARFAIHRPQQPDITEQAELIAQSLRGHTAELSASIARLETTFRRAQASASFWKSRYTEPTPPTSPEPNSP